MITPAEAYAIASQWGSYVNASDPGRWFYAFHVDDARPVSEEHRRVAVDYCRWLIHDAKTGDDKRELKRLLEFLRKAPLYGDAPTDVAREAFTYVDRLGNSCTVYGYVVRNAAGVVLFGIDHPEFDDRWRVTHMPSGYRVRQMERPTLKATRAVVRHCAGRWDWSVKTVEEVLAQTDMRLGEFIRHIEKLEP